MKLMKASVKSVHNNCVAADSLKISVVTQLLLTAAEHDRYATHIKFPAGMTSPLIQSKIEQKRKFRGTLS